MLFQAQAAKVHSTTELSFTEINLDDAKNVALHVKFSFIYSFLSIRMGPSSMPVEPKKENY